MAAQDADCVRRTITPEDRARAIWKTLFEKPKVRITKGQRDWIIRRTREMKRDAQA